MFYSIYVSVLKSLEMPTIEMRIMYITQNYFTEYYLVSHRQSFWTVFLLKKYDLLLIIWMNRYDIAKLQLIMLLYEVIVLRQTIGCILFSTNCAFFTCVVLQIHGVTWEYSLRSALIQWSCEKYCWILEFCMKNVWWSYLIQLHSVS